MKSRWMKIALGPVFTIQGICILKKKGVKKKRAVGVVRHFELLHFFSI